MCVPVLFRYVAVGRLLILLDSKRGRVSSHIQVKPT